MRRVWYRQARPSGAAGQVEAEVRLRPENGAYVEVFSLVQQPPAVYLMREAQ